MSGGHDHEHEHGEEHARTFQPDLEDTTPFSEYQYLETAVRELLHEKGIISPDDIRRAMERNDQLGPHHGAKIVARAWLDPAFKARLLADGSAGAEEATGLKIKPLHLIVVENTPEMHNMIVCTLCSCYPRFLLGKPPLWYKSREYRSRTVREPRKVLEEFGTYIPEGVEVRVHDSTADMRYMVLPMRPPGTDGMDEDELAALVTRDCMIGVTLPDVPLKQAAE